MKLSSLLNPGLVLLGVPWTDKKAVITDLVDHIVEHFETGLSREEIEKAVLERESLGGTTFPSGIAIPHSRFERFDDIIIAIGVPAEPFRDSGVDVKMVVLILTASNKPALYLNCLGAFARLSQDPNRFPRLLAARSPREFIDVVEDANILVKSTILVENVMNPNPIAIRPETPLREINDLLFKNKLSYLPVVIDHQVLVGEIRFLDILELGIPEYARELGNLSFVTSLESFENLIERESSIFARDFMKKPAHTLGPKSTLLEAAMALIKTHERQLAVVDSDRLVGVISYMDILNKIIRS